MNLNENRIKVLMADLDLSVTELAEKAELSRSTVSTVLNGKSCNTVTAGKIAKVLKVSTSELMEV